MIIPHPTPYDHMTYDHLIRSHFGSSNLDSSLDFPFSRGKAFRVMLPRPIQVTMNVSPGANVTVITQIITGQEEQVITVAVDGSGAKGRKDAASPGGAEVQEVEKTLVQVQEVKTVKTQTDLWTEVGKARQMPTGKHKGKSYFEIFEKEGNYTAWARNHAKAYIAVTDYLDWVCSQPDAA